MSSISGWRRCAPLLGALIAAGGARAGGNAPQLVIEWSVNGGAVNVALPPGVPAGSSFDYEGTLTDPASGIDLEYDFVGDPLSAVSGNVKTYNTLKSSISVAIDVRLMLEPDIVPETLLTAVVNIGLTSGPGGGEISSLPPALFKTRVDSEDAGFNATLFWDPFLIAASGQGNAATQGFYGIPTPVPGPPLVSSIGYSLRYALTPGDLASISVDLTADGEKTFCSEDLDASGAVGSEDLFTLTAFWGPCQTPGCAADLDVDDVVGMSDMLMLLQAWGPCD
jgi:hypothetical protein